MPPILHLAKRSMFEIVSCHTNQAKTTLVKRNELVNLFMIESPERQSIQENGEYNGLVNCNLCLKLNVPFIPKTMINFPKSTANFSYLVDILPSMYTLSVSLH